MKQVLVVLVLLGMASGAHSTPDDLLGGVLAAHYIPEVQWAYDPPADGWCAQYNL